MSTCRKQIGDLYINHKMTEVRPSQHCSLPLWIGVHGTISLHFREAKRNSSRQGHNLQMSTVIIGNATLCKLHGITTTTFNFFTSKSSWIFLVTIIYFYPNRKDSSHKTDRRESTIWPTLLSHNQGHNSIADESLVIPVTHKRVNFTSAAEH